MPTWFWIAFAGFVISHVLKTAIRQDCFGMTDVPPQWDERTQKWFKLGMGAMLGVMLMPLGPIVKDFVTASAHGVKRVHSLEKRNADELRAALDNLNA